MTVSTPPIAESPVTNWQQESLLYAKSHPRLVAMARLAEAMPERSMLDVGCSAGTLRRLLPSDYAYYGCDITDHAAPNLEAGHFRQIDLNATHDLSFFANRGIRVIHMGGFLEYVREPGPLLGKFRELVGSGGVLLMSMVNFEAKRYDDIAKSHHPSWHCKPRLEELRGMLSSSGWRIRQEIPFVGKVGWLGWRTPWMRYLLSARGVNHPWTRRNAWLFIVIAEAVAPTGVSAP